MWISRINAIRGLFRDKTGPFPEVKIKRTKLPALRKNRNF